MPAIGSFGGNLVRVIKHVRKRGADGKMKIVKQAYHVKSADPGDHYAHMTPDAVAATAGPAGAAVGLGAEEPQADAPQKEPTVRVAVRYHEPPWKKKEDEAKKAAEVDVIPKDVRKRFDGDNKHLRATNPRPGDVAVLGVAPTDPVLWSVDERRLLSAMRSGFIDWLRVGGGRTGLLVGRIKDQIAGSYDVLLWMDELRDPSTDRVWGKFLSKEEDFPAYGRHAAAAYELAKACGLDDVVPPTVRRFDERGDLYRLIPSSLAERREAFLEWVSQETGKAVDDVRRQAGGASAVQFKRGTWTTIAKQLWYRDRVESKGLAPFWTAMGPEVRASFLRVAMFDLLAWNMCRTIGDLAFSDEPRHPVIATGNELSLPCPRAMADAYIASSSKSFVEVAEDPGAGMPLMLSEAVSRLVSEGGEGEIADFEALGHVVSDRMTSDRPLELARALLDYKLPPLHVAGALARIWLMKTHAKDIAADPYMIADLLAAFRTGQKREDMVGVVEFVNMTMSKSMVHEFDFLKAMKAKDDDHASEA